MEMTLRTYLALRSMADTCAFVLALEAVASTAIEHPEWPMEEARTWAEWERWEGAR